MGEGSKSKVVGAYTIGVFAVGTLLTFYRAWVLTVLWSWFAVPALHLPPVGVVHMVGLLTIVRCTGDHNVKVIASMSREDYVSHFAFAIAYPMLCLGMCKLILVVFR